MKLSGLFSLYQSDLTESGRMRDNQIALSQFGIVIIWLTLPTQALLMPIALRPHYSTASFTSRLTSELIINTFSSVDAIVICP